MSDFKKTIAKKAIQLGAEAGKSYAKNNPDKVLKVAKKFKDSDELHKTVQKVTQAFTDPREEGVSGVADDSSTAQTEGTSLPKTEKLPPVAIGLIFVGTFLLALRIMRWLDKN